jgi:putative tricarboxylic transport membrane protein
MAPAGPGGGWDSAARSLQQVMTTTGVARSVQVTNVTGAGGTVGLAQFVNSAKGDGNQLMVNGITMVGAILTSQSPVNLDMVTPIAGRQPVNGQRDHDGWRDPDQPVPS